MLSRLHLPLRTSAQRDTQSIEPVHPELMQALGEIADVVSSSMGIEDVLGVIADRAKEITGSEKVVVLLTQEHGRHLDHDTIVVRGRRSQHPQSWWERRLEDLGEEAFSSRLPVVESQEETGALLLASPILVKDRPVGLLCAIDAREHRPSRGHIDFMGVLSAFAASAVENARLAEQGRYVMIASERDRIASEMHDGVLQSLFSMSLGLELCKKQLSRDPEQVSERLDELQDQLKSAMTNLRRYIYDLRPMKLAELGLAGAVEYWMRQITVGAPLQGRLRISGPLETLSPAEEACLYSVAKEAVSNVVRHANAGTFEVMIELEHGVVVLSVSDDGVGFDPARAALSGGMGLGNIKDRVAREGGLLEIIGPGEGGTRLRVELPVGQGA